MTSKQNVLYAKREHIKKQLTEVETVKGNVDMILGDKTQEIILYERKSTLN